jgi:putative tryptophan/tyrosine transport system substrate-binding protein
MKRFWIFDIASSIPRPTIGETLSIALSALLFAFCFPVQAQQPKRVPRIGFVTTEGNPKTPGPQFEAFRQGLRDLGYVVGENILVELRYPEGRTDRIPSLVTELVQLKVDLLVLGAQPAIRAAKQATKTIPIVIVTTQDPVAAGFIESLARPGGNITGLTRLTRELSGKRLELLKEVLPGTSRVGALVNETQTENDFKPYEAPARALKIQLQLIKVREPNPDFEAAFQAAAKWRATALITVSGSLFNRHIKRFAELAIRNRLPSMHERIQYVEAGGLMSYSANDADNYRRAATYVDKILKGAKPADLPVEQPTDFDLAINLKTAKQIGVTIPPNVLARADRVIR